MALVFLVIFPSIRLGSIFMVFLFTSTKTGVAPTCVITLAVAAKVIGVVITSAPGLIPEAIMAKCKPAVQELTARAYLQPAYFLNFSSNLATLGPVESQPERKESITSFISGSSIMGLPNTRNLSLTFFLFKSLIIATLDKPTVFIF